MNNMTDQQYLINPRGYQVPVDEIEPSEVIKNQTVLDLFAKAEKLQAEMKAFKTQMFADFEAFVALSAEKYGVQMGGIRGNVNLTSFDGKLRIKLKQQDRISYDEGINIAKELVDQWFIESYDNIAAALPPGSPELKSLEQQKSLIDSYFQVGKEGNISHSNMQRLSEFKFDHPLWKKAMMAISEAKHIDETRQYITFHRRDDRGQWHLVSLDFAGL